MSDDNQKVSDGTLPTAAAPKSMQATAFNAEGGMVISTFEEAWRLSQALSMSDFVPKDYKGRPENVLVAIQMGAEVGFKPMQALQAIAVINGHPKIWGDGLVALIQNCPMVEDFAEEWDEGSKTATCRILRKGRSRPYVQTFSAADAQAAGLIGKDTYKGYLRRMCQMRARSWCARDAIPDYLKGLAPDEPDTLDIDPDTGEVQRPARRELPPRRASEAAAAAKTAPPPPSNADGPAASATSQPGAARPTPTRS